MFCLCIKFADLTTEILGNLIDACNPRSTTKKLGRLPKIARICQCFPTGDTQSFNLGENSESIRDSKFYPKTIINFLWRPKNIVKGYKFLKNVTRFCKNFWKFSSLMTFSSVLAHNDQISKKFSLEPKVSNSEPKHFDLKILDGRMYGARVTPLGFNHRDHSRFLRFQHIKIMQNRKFWLFRTVVELSIRIKDNVILANVLFIMSLLMITRLIITSQCRSVCCIKVSSLHFIQVTLFCDSSLVAGTN